MPRDLLSVSSVSLTYGPVNAKVRALKEVSLAFQIGQVTLITGPSGSGKTSLLAILGCLLVPDSGEVRVMDRVVNGLSEEDRTRVRREHIGYVFQAFRLFHSLSALDNVRLACGIAGSSRPSEDAARNALDAVGLWTKVRLKPHELSGGEKQRVSIARVLASRASIILADEPTVSLDSDAGRTVAQLLLDLAAGTRIVVVVSHDLRLKAFCHRMISLADGLVVEDREI